ncbi:MAG: aldehyde dehydrogenase family protein [Catalinimonas sp.]
MQTPPPAAPLQATPDDVFKKQQQYAPRLAASTAAQRRAKLRRLRKAILAARHLLRQALHEDFGKPHAETDLTEIYPTLAEIDRADRYLERWMAPRRVSTPPAMLGAHSYVRYEPKGTSLIIAPWNYPFHLQLYPLVSAVAAGCTAVLKPSELTPRTAAVIRRVIDDVFHPREVAVFEGGKEVTQELLALPFGHIFFTGSPRVGKIVMAAAAKNLSSVTLELGGKSPTLVDETADLRAAADKIVYGKFVNAGQTCVAPDYVLVARSAYTGLLEELQRALRASYGDLQSEKHRRSYARIISREHYDRLAEMIGDAQARGARVVTGGTGEREACLLPPTLLTGCTDEMRVMQEEIFGPLLPVVPYDTAEEAVVTVRAHPTPLACYVFSERPEVAAAWLDRLPSGGGCVNETLLHVANPALPFGGVNNSGIGKSHGRAGFLAFSNERGILHQGWKRPITRLLTPPYGRWKQGLTEVLLHAPRWLT